MACSRRDAIERAAKFGLGSQPGKLNLGHSYKSNPRSFDGPIGKVQDLMGTPDQIHALLREFEDTGVNQLILLSQAGKIPHEKLCSSVELFVKEVMLEFREREQKRAGEKAAGAARTNEKAMARKKPAGGSGLASYGNKARRPSIGIHTVTFNHAKGRPAISRSRAATAPNR